MKILMSLLIIYLPAASQPQNLYNFPVDSTTGKIYFSGVVEKPGISKDLIYTRTKIWIAQTFNSAKAVINMDDKESGIIKVKGNYSEDTLLNKRVYTKTTQFNLFIYFKDGRYKYDVTDIMTDPGIAGVGFVADEPFLSIDKNDKNYIKYSHQWQQAADNLKTHMVSLAMSLDKAISTKSAAEF